MNSPQRYLSFASIVIFGSIQSLSGSTVTTTSDSGPGSLRNAIANAVNGETISFNSALNGATITLTSGELSIAGLQIAIDASGLSHSIKISGNNNSRVFVITTDSNVSLTNLVVIDGKILGGNGGGIAALQSQLNCFGVTIRNCVSSNDGGGLWANGVTGIIDRCSFLGNDAEGYGGGLFLIGSLLTNVQNSVISGNRGAIGGGIAAFASSPPITNCTIQGNSGSGLQLEFSAAPVIRNTIVWGNRIGEGSIASQQIRSGPSSTAAANVNFSLIEGNSSSLNNLDGTLSINNPKFIRPVSPTNSATPPNSNSDLRVFTNSPVLNAGDNISNPSFLDRAGKARIQSTTIDLGAFETGYVTFALLHPTLMPFNDANGNGLSNFLEYAKGTDPGAPDDAAVRPVFSTSNGFNFITSSQRVDAADVNAVWETSATLADSWQTMVLGTNYTVESTSNLSSSRQQIVLKLLDGGVRRFYRQGFSLWESM